MSSEIVPFLDGSDTPSAEPDFSGKGKALVEALTDSNAILRKPLGTMDEGVRPFDLLGLRSVESSTVRVNLFGANHAISHFLPLEKGPKCATQLNPTLESLEPLLEKIKEPSVLHLRGCDQLFSPEASPFPFEKFKTLTCLEISAVSNLTTLPEKTISEMTQLQALNLSHLPIQQLPTDFFSNLIDLRSLTLKDCPNIHSLPKLPQLTPLEYLELSHLLIETLPDGIFSNPKKIYTVVLKGCSKLSSLPSIQPLKKLRVLDLSHCIALQEMEPIEFGHLWKLDLSYTALHFISTLGKIPLVTHLFLRDAKVINFKGFSIPLLKVLDISGAQYVNDLDLLKACKKLEALDLSRTGIESIDFISGLANLRYLILKECTRLQKLPAIEKLTHLEVLDISGFDNLGDLPEDISSLKRLNEELNLSGCSGLKELSPGLFVSIKGLQTLDTVDLAAPSGSGEIDFINDRMSRMENLYPRCRLEGRLSKPNEFYIVSTFFSYSGFDRFRRHFDDIVGLILGFQENFKPASSLDTIPTLNTPPAMIDAASCHISCQTAQRDCRRMVDDLKYIRENIALLESCHNCTSAEELLDKLTNFTRDANHSSKFYEVLRTVAKLKLLVHPKQVDALEKKKKKKKSNYKQEDVSNIDINTPEMQTLSRSYDSLTGIQKNCLLYFTGFRNTSIKEKILIHLWYGEGFIDPAENVALSNANSSTNPLPTANRNLNLDPAAYSNPNPEITSMSTEIGLARDDANRVSQQVCTAKGVEDAHTIEAIGRKILMVLEKNDFIRGYGPFNRGARMWSLLRSAKSFVRARAMAEGFFNFDDKTRKLTPQFTGSQRACLLQSEDNLSSSSCKLWVNYINSSKKLENFKNISALLNVNESMVDIRAEWFSKMRNLYVLHLGGLYFKEHEAINVVDLKFLEELKNMKQLKLLSLERFPTIKKLPDSVCKLTNLKIINLRECSYLEELPAGIGSLKNLTHLDLTDCRVLSMLPKGIRLLSKLEVLKGFVITYQIGGRQHRNACTLMELLKLKKLRKLNLVVYTENFPFPDSSDLQVFNGMKNLCNLQIIWQTLKCWDQNETEELLRSNLKKLELRCFPLKTAPNWLHPSGLPKLEELFVRGGNLTTLVGGNNQKTWNVKTLVLKYLPYVYMNWEILRGNFPRMTHLEAYKCDLLSSYPFNKTFEDPLKKVWMKM